MSAYEQVDLNSPARLISGAQRLGPSTQFEDSVTFPIPSKGDYS